MSDEAQGVYAAHLTAALLEQNPTFIDDVERGVVFVPWPRPPRAGVRVGVSLAVGSEPPVGIEALVVWSRPARAGIVAGFGAQLVGAPEALLLRLRAFAKAVRRELNRGGFGDTTGRIMLEAPVQERVRARSTTRDEPTRPPIARSTPVPSPSSSSSSSVRRHASPAWHDDGPLELADPSLDIDRRSDGSHRIEAVTSYGAAEFGPEHFGEPEPSGPIEFSTEFIQGPATPRPDSAATIASHRPWNEPLPPAPSPFSDEPYLSEPEPTPFPLGDLQPDPEFAHPPVEFAAHRPSTTPSVRSMAPSVPPAPQPPDRERSGPVEPLVEIPGEIPAPVPAPTAGRLRPGDQFLPAYLLADRQEGNASLDGDAPDFADAFDFLKPAESTPGPATITGRRRINVQRPAPPSPPPTDHDTATPLGPDGIPAFSAELLDDLGFDPGTEALLPSLPVEEVEEEGDAPVDENPEAIEEEALPPATADADLFPTAPAAIDAPATSADDSLLDVLATEGAARAALAPASHQATPPAPEHDLPTLDELESALDALGPAEPAAIDALGLLPLDLGLDLDASPGSAAEGASLGGEDDPSDPDGLADPAPRRLTFVDAETYLSEYAASLEHGFVRVVADELPEPGSQIELELEIPDGEPPLRIVAEVERYLTEAESDASGWVGRVIDPDGDVADRLGNAAFALM